MEKTITFELERDTKNTYRFHEVAKGEPPLIGTLYVQKWDFETKRADNHGDHQSLTNPALTPHDAVIALRERAL